MLAVPRALHACGRSAGRGKPRRISVSRRASPGPDDQGIAVADGNAAHLERLAFENLVADLSVRFANVSHDGIVAEIETALAPAGRDARLRPLHLHRVRPRRDAARRVLGGGRRHRAARARPVHLAPVAGRRDSRRPRRRAHEPAGRTAAGGGDGSRPRQKDRPSLASLDPAARRRPGGRGAVVRRTAPSAHLAGRGDYPPHHHWRDVLERHSPGRGSRTRRNSCAAASGTPTASRAPPRSPPRSRTS